ncbi:MAG TPA: hypothetical protein ENK66_03500 [Arcobacter sp.]|nr:hypothetical protein [Arcobacter sp.]
MAKSKLDRLEKMSEVVEKADLKAANDTPKNEKKAETKRKHIIIPLEWDEAIKNNYGGTATSYILTALKKQLESDGYL